MQQQYGTRNKVLRYQEKRRSEKKIHKKRKREWEKKQSEELQNLYDTREARKLYSKVRETKKEFKPRVNQSFVIKMKYWHDGMNILITSSTKIKTRNMPLQNMEIHGP